MFLLTEPFVSAEIEYRRERAMTRRNGRLLPVVPRRREARTHRALSFVHRIATGH
jgi:hypothetical protein